MAAVATFLQSTNSTADLTTYTFSTQNLGTASSDRYIVVNAAAARSGGLTGAINSITVQGISGSSVVQRTQDTNIANIQGLFIVAVPTGTTGDVVVTFNGSCVRAGIALWAVTGIGSATAYDTATANDSGVNPNPSNTIDCEADGIIIAASFINNAATTSGTAWTGVTEDYEQTVESNSRISGASDEFATLQTGLTITSAWTNSNAAAEASLVAASWSGGGASTTIKTYNGTLTANVKTVLNGTAIANRKTWNGIT